MIAVLLGRIAALYSGLAAAALLVLLALIARFYQRQAHVRSGYPVFLLPALALLLAGTRYATLDGQISGDLAADLLRLGGGACLIGWGAYLLRLMTGSHE
jgi:hypothetical protein